MPWIASQIPHARLSIIGAAEGESHFMDLENPNAFNAEVRNFSYRSLLSPGASAQARTPMSALVIKRT
jgi:hypothetical protein